MKMLQYLARIKHIIMLYQITDTVDNLLTTINSKMSNCRPTITLYIA